MKSFTMRMVSDTVVRLQCNDERLDVVTTARWVVFFSIRFCDTLRLGGAENIGMFNRFGDIIFFVVAISKTQFRVPVFIDRVHQAIGPNRVVVGGTVGHWID